MIGRARKSPRAQRHGNIFSREAGSMYVHVQRESGLAHHTMVLRPWQVQALRLVTSRWFLLALCLGVASWGYFAVQAARVPLLNGRISSLEQDARRIDSLQKTLIQMQAQYEKVQHMLSAPSALNAVPTRTPKSATPDVAGARSNP